MKIIFISKNQYLLLSEEPNYPNEKQKGSSTLQMRDRIAPMLGAKNPIIYA
jgi:hypothetical protein